MSSLFLGADPETNAIQSLSLERHALTIAGSRMGKGACQIIPTLREWPSSTIVIDPKGEAVREFVGPKNLEKKVALNSKDVQKLVSRSSASDKGRSPSAKNVFVHQKYKSGLRQVMNKPDVKNRELREVMDFLYREGATVGSGSTADAIRYERKTGQPVGNRWHSNKGRESIKRLEKWLKNNPNASGSDREVAEHVILDLKDSLGE